MEEIIALLSSKPEDAIAQLTQYQKPITDINNYREEYSRLKRDIRETQIGKLIKNKDIPASGDKPAKVVIANRVAVPFAKKIVQTSTAFEVGERVVVTPREKNTLADEILRLWDTNRIDDKIQKLIEVKKSETESAIVFYIADIDPETMFNKILGPNKEKEIKCVVRTSKEGKMSPYYDAYGDMQAFVWSFSEKIGDKDIKRVWVYDNQNLYKLSDESGALKLDAPAEAHGFSKIPVVYFSQDTPEWFDVAGMIDRYETSFSKLGSANDYAGYPILALYGQLASMPGKDDDGKTFQFPIEVKPDGTQIHGDAKFLTMDNAPASVKLELEALENLIHSLSSTPQMSLNDIKGLGAVSGVAIKLMFLDAIIKAKLNEGYNRTSIERILNVLISGTVITTNVSMKTAAESLFFDVTFKSILPTDFKELVEYLAQGVTAGIISKDTAVRTLGLVGVPEDELTKILEEKKAAAELAPATPGGTGSGGDGPTPADPNEK